MQTINQSVCHSTSKQAPVRQSLSRVGDHDLACNSAWAGSVPPPLPPKIESMSLDEANASSKAANGLVTDGTSDGWVCSFPGSVCAPKASSKNGSASKGESENSNGEVENGSGKSNGASSTPPPPLLKLEYWPNLAKSEKAEGSLRAKGSKPLVEECL